MSAYMIWLIMAGFFLILEIATEGFLVFWFAVGALVAMGTSFLTENIAIQISVFVITTLVLILSTRKLTEKIKPKEVPSNVYTILGKKAIVTVEINSIKGQGQVKIGGDIWSAKTEDDSIIPVNTEVEILKIDGVKAVVKII